MHDTHRERSSGALVQTPPPHARPARPARGDHGPDPSPERTGGSNEPARADDSWLIAPREGERARELCRRLGISPVTGHLLVRLGYEQVEAAREFLDPQLKELLPPEGLPDMDLGSARLERAIAQGERVLLFGDYDVDGITGASILFEVLTALGAVVEVHIPDREEGYGLNRPRLERAVADGVRVVVSIDNGIAAVDEAAYLADRGLDLIICDHHTLGETLPQAVARIHPGLPGSTYANPHLCGAGVAFKLAWATATRMGAPDAAGTPRAAPAVRKVLVRCIALVALGTVADVVPLVGENRVLVRHGLKLLRSQPTAGIQALLEVAKVGEEPDTTDVGFRIAPRLNAAGRMGQAQRSFRLLVTQDAAEGQRLAQELDRENKHRRDVQARVFREAREQIEAEYLAGGCETVQAAGIVAWADAPSRDLAGQVDFDAGWPHGIVGIVASKVTETFQRPALMVAVEGDVAKGSGRSVAGVDLLAALEPHRALFTRLGGHKAAVGFTIPAANLPRLREAFAQGVSDSLGLGPEVELREVLARLDGYEVTADAEVELGEVSRELVSELERLSPFGEGNREPLFAARALTLAGEPRLMGDSGQHVSFLLRQGDRVVRTVAFNRRDVWDLLRELARPGPGIPPTFQVAFRPRINRFRGEVKVELELKAIRPESA